MARMKKVVKVLKKERADALLVWNSEGGGQPATSWLSGFTGSSSLLLLTRTKRLLMTDGRYAAQSAREAKGYDIRTTSASRSALRLLEELFRRRAVTRVVFDGTITPYSAVEEARDALPGIAFLSRPRMLQELRIVKEKSERAFLAKAAAVACRAWKRLVPLIRVDMTEKELARRLEALCIEEGADTLAFPTIVASGKNGALPHAQATEKKIQKGELITIDFGVRRNGYVSDMTRTVAMGEISLRLRKMYEAVRVAQELGCGRARAGMAGQELDAVCRGYLTKKRYGKYFTHATGHGIGREVHELPIAAAGNAGENRLPPGSVITCEPGVYIPGVGGVRIEDTLALVKRGNVNLTGAVSKKLLALPC